MHLENQAGNSGQEKATVNWVGRPDPKCNAVHCQTTQKMWSLNVAEVNTPATA